MGQALYRKYRSKSLDEVVGQEHITSTLKNALKTGKISHAYLLTGPKGVGKTSIARILAHEVNGFEYNESNVHLDIIEIDAASNRRIDEIRDLRDKVHIAPTIGKYKVYIIDEVHMLTKEAFNALLKTLEEPPQHVIFILATTESHKLPETIVSRTQRYNFKPIDQTKIIEHLRSIAKSEHIQIDDDALTMIAEHGDGSFRDSISLLDQVSATGNRVGVKEIQEMLGIAPTRAIESLLESTHKGSPKEVIDNLSKLLEQGYDATNIAKQLSTVIRSQIINGEQTIGTVKSTKLLKSLLDVPSSSNPERLLELCLLETVLKNDQPAIKKPKIIEKKEALQPLDEQVDAPQQIIDKKPINKSDQAFDVESWAQILPAMKAKHSTLYGILRMGVPSYANDTLTLSFNFAFHQKRINEPRNRQIINNYISTYTSQPIQIVAVLSPEQKSVESNDKDGKVALKNISNIFGGAEVLDS